MRIGNPLPVSLPQESSKATRIFKSFISPTGGIDGLIPSQVLRSAQGFAVFTVAKAGFLMSVRAGTGVVVARLPDGHWSPPSAIGIGGMGFGGQLGAEVAEFILVLNSQSALTQFMSAGSITLGGNLSVALGPIGRNAEGAGALNSKGKLAAMYSYSKTKGAFAGISVEGSAIFQRQDCNIKAYGPKATATKLLSGHFDVPTWAEDLVRVLTVCAGSYTEYVDQHHPLPLARNPSFENAGHREQSRNPFRTEVKTPAMEWRNKEPGVSREFCASPPPREPYTFGSSYASMSSTPPPKQQPKKGMFTPSAWKLGSRQNSGKTEQSSSSGRSTPVGHWMDSMRSHSARSSDERLTQPHERAFTGAHGSKSSQDSTGEHAWAKAASDAGSLSSIGSEEEGHGEELPEPSPPRDAEPLSFALADAGRHRRHWVDAHPHPADVLEPKRGNIADLISFDQIGPPSPDAGYGRAWTAPAGPRPPVDPDHKDFLVATSLPSVARTHTHLAGFVGKVTATFDFVGDQPGDLSFKKGDDILVVEKTDNQWWLGSIGLRRGIFPVNRVSGCVQ